MTASIQKTPVDVGTMPPESFQRALDASEFQSYETTVDGELQLQELNENGKLDEFIWRFVYTPIAVAQGSFLKGLSPFLKNEMRNRYAVMLAEPEHYRLDATVAERLAYWLSHELKQRGIRFEIDLTGEFSQNDMALTEDADRYASSAVSGTESVHPSIRTENYFNRWLWTNSADVRFEETYERFALDDNGDTSAQTRPIWGYGAYLFSGLQREESFGLSLEGGYRAYVNSFPDEMESRLRVKADGVASGKVFGRLLSVKVGGEYENKNYAAPALSGQATQDYEALQGDAGLSYQAGTLGVVVDTSYSRIHDVTAFDDNDSVKANATALLQTDIKSKAKMSLQAGLGAQFENSSSTLTGLSTAQGDAQGSVRFKCQISKSLQSETYVLGAYNYSDGSLIGWYPEAQDVNETLRFAPGTSGKLGLNGSFGISGYSRNLTFVGDDGVPMGKREQREFNTKMGIGVDYAPKDWLNFSAAGHRFTTDQSGFLPVDNVSYDVSAKGALRVTKSVSRRETWLSLNASREFENSHAEASSYEQGRTAVFLSLDSVFGGASLPRVD
jgi:hypothetical protein